MNKILQGDCLIKLKELEDNSVDSIVTDPPYGLGFMGKEWDTFDKSQFGKKGEEGANDLKVKKNFNILPRYNTDGLYEFSRDWAKECLRVLKPGGYILAFAGTRTYHKITMGIEDAGFEVRDMIEWVYGSGFPKSLNIGKAVDKLQGNERKTIGVNDFGGTSFNQYQEDGRLEKSVGTREITKGTSEWEGWGTALKPAHEPICMARKPLAEKTVAENCLKYGTGGINIDGSRVEGEPTPINKLENWSGFGQEKRPDYVQEINTQGRFPANLIHDNSEEVRECFPNESERFFKSIIYQAKSSKSERNKGLDSIVLVDILKVWNENNTTKEEKLIRLMVTGISPQKVIGESGVQLKNANEWNTCLFGKHLMEKYREDIKSITKTETNSITTSQTLNWLIHLLTNEYTVGANLEMENGGNLVANVENSNTLIITINEAMASALGVKDVVSGTQLKISVKEGSNIHSTVKPVALMEYLIKMVTPKGGVVLDPFAGSGSTLVAAKQNGFQYIGIEREEEYIPIIEARLNTPTNTLF